MLLNRSEYQSHFLEEWQQYRLRREYDIIKIQVSDEYGTQLGDQVGYRVRFDTRASSNTKIEYVTDGTLVQLMMADPLLQLYTVIMIDDVHERTINTDLVLALLKKIRRKRPDLKLVISSATVQAQEIAQYFEDSYKDHKFQSKILEIQGRTFPVDVICISINQEDFLSQRSLQKLCCCCS